MSPERRGLLYVAGAALLWSTGGVGIKEVPASPLTVVFFRSGVAAVTLLLLFRPRLRFTSFFLASLVSYAGCLTTFVVATKWTTAANAIFLQYSGIIWVLLLSPLVLGERLRRDDVIAVSVSLLGMALFFAGKLEPSGLAGSLMAVLSGVFFAGIFLFLRRAKAEGSEAAVTWGNVLAALAVAPWAETHVLSSPRAMVLLAYLGVFQIGLAYALLVRGLRHVSATQASLMGMLEPITNPIWVFLRLGETPSTWAALGGAIVLSAIGWRTLRTNAA